MIFCMAKNCDIMLVDLVRFDSNSIHANMIIGVIFFLIALQTFSQLKFYEKRVKII